METKIEPITDLDLQMLNALYIDGKTIKDVCEAFKVTFNYVGKLVRKPEVQEFVENIGIAVGSEYAGLELEGIKAIRDGLNSDRDTVRLNAADKLFRILGRYKDSPVVGIDAESVKFVVKIANDGRIDVEKETGNEIKE